MAISQGDMCAYELMRFVIIAIRKLPKEISVMSCFLCCECIQRKIIFSFGMFLETGLHFTIKATTTVITTFFFLFFGAAIFCSPNIARNSNCTFMSLFHNFVFKADTKKKQMQNFLLPNKSFSYNKINNATTPLICCINQLQKIIFSSQT